MKLKRVWMKNRERIIVYGSVSVLFVLAVFSLAALETFINYLFN